MKKVTLAISLFLISMFYVFFVNAYAEGAEVKEKTVTPNKLEFDIATETATTTTTNSVITVDGFEFDTSTGTIIKYTPPFNSMINLTIPSKINGITVKTIGETAFVRCDNLVKVTIPNSVTSIEFSAFLACRNLKEINIPNSVTSIKEQAFAHCKSLTSIKIPDSVILMEGWIFQSCENLASITISKNITSIDKFTFSYCTSLTSITIPDSVTSIKMGAFQGCANLTSITIPDNVTSIGESAFASCTNLTSITISDSVTSIGKSAFASCTNLTSITIPDSVTSIENNAFASCTNLTSITIPDSITSIGYYAFFKCNNLTSVYCYKGSMADNKALYPNSNVKFYYLDEMSNIDFKVKDTEGRAGEEVDVYVSVDNNSGLAVYDLKVNFDKTKVTPVSITQINSDEISGGLVSNLRKPSVSAESLDFVTAVWSNASNVTYNGDLFKIRFKIKEDVLYSEVPITLEFNEDGLLDENYETLTPSITNGKITVYPPYEFGDINMDGKINARDLLMLTQYLAEYNNITFNTSQLYLADVYKDGTIDLLDLLLLKQYLAGWDVILGQTIAQNISLFSDDSISLDLNSEYISDDEIKVSVLAKDNPGIAAFKLKLNYDNTALTPVSLTKGTAVTGSITTNINALNENSNYVTALWSDVVNSNSDGVLYSVIFKVKDNSSGNTKLSLTCSEKDIINENFMNISSNQAEIELQTDNQ